MGIEVQAFRGGFFGGERKRVGEKFTVPDSTIESGWFEPVDPKVKLKPRPELTPAQKADRELAARVKRKKAERARINAERKGSVKDKPIALSEMHHKDTAREQAAAAKQAESEQAAENGEGNTPLV